MRRFDLTLKIEVPDDPFEAAEAVAALKTPWRGMQEALKASGVKFEARQTVGQRKAAVVSNGAPKRGRPRKARNTQPQPQLPVAEDDPF